MDNERVLASLSYFSIFFAPFLFPIILFFIVKDEFVKQHAKRALLSHLVPVVFGFILVFLLLTSSWLADINDSNGTGIVIGMLAYLAVTFGFFVWKIVQGIRVLKF